jgi:hypothetical protein
MRDLGIDVALTTIDDAVLRVGVQTPEKIGKNHKAYCVLRMRPP